MPRKTCSAMTSLHHSPSMAPSMYPSKAGYWTSEPRAKAVQRLCLDILKLECEESGRLRAQDQLFVMSSEANLTAQQ